MSNALELDRNDQESIKEESTEVVEPNFVQISIYDIMGANQQPS